MTQISLPAFAEVIRQFASQLRGGGGHRHYRVSFALEGYGVDDDAIPAAAKAVLDQMIADYHAGKAGAVSQAHLSPVRSRITQIVGHCSLTGAELHNADLGHRRAEKIWTYLKDGGIPPALLGTVGSSGASAPRPGHEAPGVEDPANRRVEVHHEVQVWIPAPPPPPASPPAPPPDASKQWDIYLHAEFGLGAFVLGGNVFMGELENVRTQQKRPVVITWGGVDVGSPVTASGTIIPTPQRLDLPYWVRFEDFEGMVGIVDAGAPSGSYTYIQFIGLPGAPSVHITGSSLGVEASGGAGIGYFNVVGI